MPRGHFALKLFFYPNDSSSERFCWKFWASFSGYTSIIRDQGYTNFSNFNLSLFDPSCRSKRLSDRSSKMNLLSILCSQTGASGGGQVVSMLAFYSDNPSSNPAEACIFSVNFVFEKNENPHKRGSGWPILKNRKVSNISLRDQLSAACVKRNQLSAKCVKCVKRNSPEWAFIKALKDTLKGWERQAQKCRSQTELFLSVINYTPRGC